MYRVEVKKVSNELMLYFANKYIKDFTEIVYIAEEFILDIFSTTNICYREKNKIVERGSTQEITKLIKVNERLE